MPRFDSSSEGTSGSSLTSSSASDGPPTPNEGVFPCSVCRQLCLYGQNCISCPGCNVWIHLRCMPVASRPARSEQRSDAALSEWRNRFVCPSCVGPRVLCASCNIPAPYHVLCGTCALPLHKCRECVCPRCISCPTCNRKCGPPHSIRCEQCDALAHRRCVDDGLCRPCSLSKPLCCSCFHRCRGATVECNCCDGTCHPGCRQDGVCNKCQRSGVNTPLHYIGDLRACPQCGARQFSITRKYCCSGGKHILNDTDVAIPRILMDFLVDHAQTLVRSAREVNQLASVAAVGVQSLALDGSARPKGGVKQRYEEAVAEIQGRIYHFDLLKGGMRSHPLLGCAQSYLFVESTIGQSKRFTKCVAAAALDLRKILRECNPIILRLRRIINFDYLDKCYDEIVRSSSTQVEFQSSFNNSATAQGQLLLLFSVRGSPFECPNVRARMKSFQQIVRLDVNYVAKMDHLRRQNNKRQANISSSAEMAVSIALKSSSNPLTFVDIVKGATTAVSMLKREA